eukprot:365693-Chlamydomonas_euryale.AAC.16
MERRRAALGGCTRMGLHRAAWFCMGLQYTHTTAHSLKAVILDTPVWPLRSPPKKWFKIVPWRASPATVADGRGHPGSLLLFHGCVLNRSELFAHAPASAMFMLRHAPMPGLRQARWIKAQDAVTEEEDNSQELHEDFPGRRPLSRRTGARLTPELHT